MQQILFTPEILQPMPKYQPPFAQNTDNNTLYYIKRKKQLFEYLSQKLLLLY